MKNKKKTDVIIEVSDREYARALSRGANPENTLKPGKHVFRRGGFLERHPETRSSTKVSVSIRLDSAVLEFFKSKASAPNAAPYQT